MEYLDPKRQRAHLIRLFTGYILIGTALILTTIILLYQAYGFGLKNGEVIQNGLVFISSNPAPADIYVNGKKYDETTNARLLIPAGKYSFELRRDGYRSWKRAVSLEGGALQRFDYPKLFPIKLNTQTTKSYPVKPTLATQSPDRRWLIVQANADYRTFDIFDATKPDKEPVSLMLPAAISTLNGAHSWSMVEWSNDNSHVLLRHTTDNAGRKTSEYILLSREKPAESLNLTATLGTNPSQLTLLDKKYDKYVMHTADGTLQTASLAAVKPVIWVKDVLAYQTYGESTVVYATIAGAEAGKATIKLQNSDKTYGLRTVTAGSQYMLDIAKYDGDWFLVAGSVTENRTYIYKNPMAALDENVAAPLVPVQVLKVDAPTRVSFSDNTRFVMAENGQQFSVYDAEYDKKYAYTTNDPIDAPQTHIEWMDGHRMMYVSGGTLVVFDYDNTNSEKLMITDPQYGAFFNRNYEAVYGFSTQTTKNDAGQDVMQYTVTTTPLRASQDL
jgi:hypothetical protein